MQRIPERLILSFPSKNFVFLCVFYFCINSRVAMWLTQGPFCEQRRSKIRLQKTCCMILDLQCPMRNLFFYPPPPPGAPPPTKKNKTNKKEKTEFEITALVFSLYYFYYRLEIFISLTMYSKTKIKHFPNNKF